MQMDRHDSNIEMEKQKADALKKQICKLINHENLNLLKKNNK
jgi:hypothetical protein